MLRLVGYFPVLVALGPGHCQRTRPRAWYSPDSITSNTPFARNAKERMSVKCRGDLYIEEVNDMRIDRRWFVAMAILFLPLLVVGKAYGESQVPVGHHLHQHFRCGLTATSSTPAAWRRQPRRIHPNCGHGLRDFHSRG